MDFNKKDGTASKFLVSNINTVKVINEFLKFRYLLIFILLITSISAFSYKYYIHEKEYIISTDIHINPNLPKALYIGDILYFSEYIVAALLAEPENILKQTQSTNYLTDEIRKLSNRFENIDSFFDKYISIIRDKENLSDSIEQFFQNELAKNNNVNDNLHSDFIKDKIARVSFEITKIPNMSLFNRMIVMKFIYSDYDLGNKFISFHVNKTNKKINENLKNQEHQLIDDVKDFLEGYILLKEIEIDSAKVNRRNELLSFKRNIESEIRIAEKLGILKPSDFYNTRVPGTYPSLVPELYNMYWKGSEVLKEEMKSINIKIDNLEKDRTILSLKNEIVKYKELLDQLVKKESQLIINENKRQIQLVQWSEKDIEYKLNFTSDAKLFISCIVLSITLWLFISMLYMVIRDWPTVRSDN